MKLESIKQFWNEVKAPVMFIGGVAVVTMVLSTLLRDAEQNYPGLLHEPTDGSPEELPDVDWDEHEPEKLSDIQIIKDGEVVFDNYDNNVNIINALRLANAVVAGDRKADWAMPIIQDWLAKVE